MKVLKNAIFILVLIGILGGCGNDSVNPTADNAVEEPPPIVGDWEATSLGGDDSTVTFNFYKSGRFEVRMFFLMRDFLYLVDADKKGGFSYHVLYTLTGTYTVSGTRYSFATEGEEMLISKGMKEIGMTKGMIYEAVGTDLLKIESSGVYVIEGERLTLIPDNNGDSIRLYRT